MTRIKKMGIGLFSLGLLATASILSIVHGNTYAANTLAGNNEVISVATTDGQPANASVNLSGVSGDGNTLLVSSTATNLPNAGGTTGGWYIYNIRTNTTVRVDISASGTLPNGNVVSPFMSDNGRYVYFQSYATNLIDGTTQYPTQTYVRDLQAGTIVAMSNHYWSGLTQDIDYPMGISNDGRFVLLGTRFIGVGYPNFYNAMLGDRSSGSPAWTSIGQTPSNTGLIRSGSISCDGSFAVYEQDDSIKLADSRNGSPVTTTISSSQSHSPKISCNGNYILYSTQNRTDVSPTPPGAGTYRHSVEYNRLTGERKYIDTNSSGAFDSSHSSYAYSVANTGDAIIKYDGNMYLKHISDNSGTLESVGKAVDGAYVSVSSTSLLTSDARYVFFTADPYDLGLTSSPSANQIIRSKTNL